MKEKEQIYIENMDESRSSNLKKAMQKTNTIITIILIILSIIQYINILKFDDSYKWTALIQNSAFFIISIMLFIIGVLLPKHPVIKPTGILLRGWPMALVMVGIFMQAIIIPVIPVNKIEGLYKIIMISSMALQVVLLITSIIWEIEHSKQSYRNLKVRFLAYVTVFGVLIISGIVAFYKGGPSPEEKIISQDPIITQEELNEINEKLDNLENNQNTGEKGEYQTVNQIKQKILEDLEAEKVYYKIVTNEGDGDYSLISFVIWTEENENVYIYQYRKYEEGYILNLAMKSSSMTKNELEGQEDGIWGK